MTSGVAQTKSLSGVKVPSSRRVSLAVLILLAMGLGLLMTFVRVSAVWQTGSILDSDDAMRLVQVRALLEGQGWFDMTAYRLDPPSGSFMHWSRVVDIPLALLIKGFEVFMPSDAAERMTRIVFPLLLQVALYGAIARLARSLIGSEAIAPAIFLVLLSGMELVQFQPGRIDHHAPQIVLLVFMLGTLVDAVKIRRAASASIAGGLAALSMAISLENLPFILIFLAFAVILWIWHGRPMRDAMAGFAAGLLIALPLCFFATVGPAHWRDAVPDAYSLGHLIGGMIGAALCLALAFLPDRFSSHMSRFGLAILGGAITLGLVALITPGVLQSPFAGLDPLIRDIWLINVHEAWTFVRLARQEPDTAAMFMLPLLFGLIAASAAVCVEKDRSRLAWIIVLAICLAGGLLGLWLVRVLSSVGPIAPLGGVWAVMKLNRRLETAGRRKAAIWSFALLLPFASIPWALALSGEDDAKKPAAEDCRAPSAFTAFSALPAGLVLAPIDAGSHLLAFTSHSVLAAPYHRNNHGNKIALEAFLAPTDTSRVIVKASGAKYVAICAGFKETSGLAERSPDSLAKALVEGHPPDWLLPVPAANTPYKIFTVRP